MKKLHVALCLASLCAVPAEAAVDYLYSSADTYFQFKRSNFVTTPSSLTLADLDYCFTYSGYTCQSIDFSTGLDAFGTQSDIISYTIVQAGGSSPFTVKAWFNLGTLSTPGGRSANLTSTGAPTTLIVAGRPDVSSPAPEPAAWMTMLLGFAAIGGALRHRRAARVRFA